MDILPDSHSEQKEIVDELNDKEKRFDGGKTDVSFSEREKKYLNKKFAKTSLNANLSRISRVRSVLDLVERLDFKSIDRNWKQDLFN